MELPSRRKFKLKLNVHVLGFLFASKILWLSFCWYSFLLRPLWIFFSDLRVTASQAKVSNPLHLYLTVNHKFLCNCFLPSFFLSWTYICICSILISYSFPDSPPLPSPHTHIAAWCWVDIQYQGYSARTSSTRCHAAALHAQCWRKDPGLGRPHFPLEGIWAGQWWSRRRSGYLAGETRVACIISNLFLCSICLHIDVGGCICFVWCACSVWLLWQLN